jgi:hypothetical protein
MPGRPSAQPTEFQYFLSKPMIRTTVPSGLFRPKFKYRRRIWLKLIDISGRGRFAPLSNPFAIYHRENDPITNEPKTVGKTQFRLKCETFSDLNGIHHRFKFQSTPPAFKTMAHSHLINVQPCYFFWTQTE